MLLFSTESAKYVIALVFLALMLGGIETGFRLGRRSESRFTDATKSHVSAIAATLLGVLGLLLGFTISMAVSRYEKRTQLVQDEANAIGTAYLRTHLLPPPEGAPIANLLTEYVEQPSPLCCHHSRFRRQSSGS